MAYEETLQAFRRGDNAEAARLAKLDLRDATAAGDVEGEVGALCMLARVALRDGDVEVVAARAAEALRAARAARRRPLERMPLHLQSVAARMAGHLDEARELYLRSIELSEELGEARMAAAEHRNLAYVELRAGNESRARELLAECQRRLMSEDTSALAPYLTFDEATVAALDGDLETAAAKLGDADRQFTELGLVPDPDDAAELALLRRLLQDSEAARGTD